MKRRLLAGALLATLLVLGQSGLSDAEPQAYVATIQTVKGRFRAVSAIRR